MIPNKSTFCISFFCFFMFTACQQDSKKTGTDTQTTASTTASPTSLEELSTRLRVAFEKKDVALLRPLLAENIADGFSDAGAICPNGCPVDSFLIKKFVDKSTWQNFEEAVLYGFGRDKSGAVAPYYARAIEDGNYVFIIGEKVNIRAAAGKKSAVVSQKSKEVVEYDVKTVYDEHLEAEVSEPILVDKDSMGWLKILLPNKKIGYVSTDFVKFPGAHEIEAANFNGKWLITGMYDLVYVCGL
jgi:hypothetical protein